MEAADVGKWQMFGYGGCWEVPDVGRWRMVHSRRWWVLKGGSGVWWKVAVVRVLWHQGEPEKSDKWRSVHLMGLFFRLT